MDAPQKVSREGGERGEKEKLEREGDTEKGFCRFVPKLSFVFCAIRIAAAAAAEDDDSHAITE